jgi:hypothetical protein
MLDIQCDTCRHRVIVNVDHLPGDLAVPEKLGLTGTSQWVVPM